MVKLTPPHPGPSPAPSGGEGEDAARVGNGSGLPNWGQNGNLSPRSALAEIEKTVLALPVEQGVLLAESLLGSLPPVGEA